MQHLLSLADCSTDEVRGLLSLAAQVKQDPQRYRTALTGKKLAMIFMKPSTRTRVSFEVGMVELGGHPVVLSSRELQLGRGETVADMARVLARFVDGIMARVFAHQDLEEMTAGGIPVINGLSDLLHPCQALADMLLLIERRGTATGLELAYVGDGNNVLHSLLHVAAHVGLIVRVATPPGYEPDRGVLQRARDLGAQVTLTNDPIEAVSGADAVYTDVWASMGQEDEARARQLIFAPYQVNLDLFERAKPDALFLHCLPAHRGEEVTSEVVDHPRSVVYDQAENRLHAQKAVLLHLLGGLSVTPSL
ncbi:MAG: ornithine carbamoyltransferase [Myxococcota bacterium]